MKAERVCERSSLKGPEDERNAARWTRPHTAHQKKSWREHRFSFFVVVACLHEHHVAFAHFLFLGSGCSKSRRLKKSFEASSRWLSKS